ncbi:MAG: cupin domain-containing protein [Clostridia bacterium]|nr:cupin domain-containing protein [Clostridia bacterium]
MENYYKNNYNSYMNCYNYNYNYNKQNNSRSSDVEDTIEKSREDFGPEPLVTNIEDMTKDNNTFRTALWTGEHLQLTLMSIPVGDSIGLEMHADTDQFIRIEEGLGLVQMGEEENNVTFQRRVGEDYAILIPAGKWHNIVNIGNVPLKLYSIYAPPHHPYGTVQMNKNDMMGKS